MNLLRISSCRHTPTLVNTLIKVVSNNIITNFVSGSLEVALLRSVSIISIMSKYEAFAVSMVAYPIRGIIPKKLKLSFKDLL